nr:MAG TPA: hypothetical protein [Caudoviricetes sp.]
MLTRYGSMYPTTMLELELLKLELLESEPELASCITSSPLSPKRLARSE